MAREAAPVGLARRDAMSQQLFLAEHVARAVPVVITGLLTDWTASRSWCKTSEMAASLRATGFDPDVDVAVAPASNRPSAKRKRDSSAHFSGDVHNSLSTVMAFNTFVDYLTAVPNDSSDSSNSEKRWSQQRLYLAQCPIWMPPNGGGSENQAPLKHIFEQVSPAPPVSSPLSNSLPVRQQQHERN